MKTIPLTQGKVAIVDDEDYVRLNKYKWFAHKEGNQVYAVRNIKLANGKRTLLQMHRAILNPLPSLQVDHINGNGLDNRKANLRICTRTDNAQNQLAGNRKGTSKYKGVSWNKKEGKWYSRITYKRNLLHIGSYKNEEDAAKAYDKKAKELFGEFANINF